MHCLTWGAAIIDEFEHSHDQFDAVEQIFLCFSVFALIGLLAGPWHCFHLIHASAVPPFMSLENGGMAGAQ